MYSLISENSPRHILEREFVPFLAALVIAQLFFKWGSFALELVGFVVLWFILGLIADRLLRALGR